jgi:UDP-glucose:O-linked fucose beta-1,3-glucosyltransferase
MEERKSEISVHKDVLKAQYKTINDEKHKLITDLRDRESKVEKLKARFEIVPRGDDEGHSQAYFVIKAAQKREELQRKGDELDQDVRKCERDIRALQATLDHLNVLTLSYLLTYLLTHLLTHLLTYLLTHSLTNSYLLILTHLGT